MQLNQWARKGKVLILEIDLEMKNKIRSLNLKLDENALNYVSCFNYINNLLITQMIF
jgi:hypothetical protein